MMTPTINYADLYDYLCEEVAQHGECDGQWEFDTLDSIDVEYCGYEDAEGEQHVLLFDYEKFNQLIN